MITTDRPPLFSKVYMKHNWEFVGNKVSILCLDCGEFHYWRMMWVMEHSEQWIKELNEFFEKEDCDGIMKVDRLNRYHWEYGLCG